MNLHALGTAVGLAYATWTASAGTIDATGHYIAPRAVTHTVEIILRVGSYADTAYAAVEQPTTVVSGIGFGFSQVWLALGKPNNAAVSTLAQVNATPATIIGILDTMRTRRIRVLTTMTGGSHPLYMSVINDTLRFDMAKWRAAMAAYQTPEIQAAVAKAVTDGILVGNSVMDEPHVYGLGDGNTWGPRGTMTKVRVDSLCAYQKEILPTLPAGVTHQHDVFEPANSYRVCEFLVDQYNSRLGTPTQFRDRALAMANRDSMAIVFGLNILGGGYKDADAKRDPVTGTWTGWDCAREGGYRGPYAPLCQMTPTQAQSWGSILIVAGCAFRIWRWDDQDLVGKEYGDAFSAVALRGATTAPPATGCRRTQ